MKEEGHERTFGVSSPVGVSDSAKEAAVKDKKMAKSRPKSLRAKAVSQNQAKRVKGGSATGGGGAGKIKFVKYSPPA